MKSALVFTILFYSFSLFSQYEVRELTAFNTLEVSAGIKVILYNSDRNYAEITTSKGDLEDLETEISGNTLDIAWASSSWGSFMSNRSAEVKLYFTNIEEIDISSGSNVTSNEVINSASFALEASSGAYAALAIECKDLTIDISSGASVNLEGKTVDQEVDISSGASYKGLDLISENTDISASSGASAKIYVTAHLSAEVSSGASIKYDGNPKSSDIDDDKWSGGSIRKY